MEFPVFLVKLDNIRTIEEASQKIFENSNLDERPERVEWPQGDTLRKRWLPGNAGETIGVNEINYTDQESFKYIFLNAYVERARNIVKGPNRQWLDRSDRINKVESEVLFLEYENNVFMAVYMNLTKSHYKLNFILKITPVADEIKREKRMKWLETVNSNLELSPIELKHLYFNLYSFLYCYDLEWLNQQICKLNKVTPCDNYNSKVFIKRDRKVLLYLKDIVKESILWGSTDVFPCIDREIEILDLHDELPYLKQTFNYIEKHRQFYSRTQEL